MIPIEIRLKGFVPVFHGYGGSATHHVNPAALCVGSQHHFYAFGTASLTKQTVNEKLRTKHAARHAAFENIVGSTF